MDMSLVKRILLAGAFITLVGASSVIACKNDYNREPTAITTPAQSPTPTLDGIVTPTPDATTIPNPTPTLEATVTPEIIGPYKLYAPTATKEEFDNFNSALDKAWVIIKNVYGREPNDKIVVYINASKQGYGISLMQEVLDARGSLDFLKTPHDDIGGYTIRDFLADQIKERGIKHELAHRFNQSLFPTKNNIEPWYNTFDEGSAKYASGEVEAYKTGGMDFKKDDSTLTTIVGNKAILDYLISNPNQFWERHNFGGNPGHLTGLILYWSLEREGLTPEKNVVAMKNLAEYYKEPGIRTNKEMIKSAYETALGKNLNHLFNDWLQPGINRFYPTATPTPTSR